MEGFLQKLVSNIMFEDVVVLTKLCFVYEKNGQYSCGWTY